MGAAVLWALVAYLTHYAFSWGALGLGALVGVAVRKAAGQGNPSLGITAAALAVGALIFGKLLIHMFALQPMVEDEILENQQAINLAYFVDMTERRGFSPALRAALPDSLLTDSVPVALRRRMLEEALDSARRARSRSGRSWCTGR
jgi:mannose/fructose/N-acetylgalactosamine-specific phosphotransferase system component IID